jgi:transcription termination factor Rho
VQAEPAAPERGAAPAGPPRAELEARPLADLHQLAAGAGILRYRLLRREDLIARLADDARPAPPASAPARAPALARTPAPAKAEPVPDRAGAPAARARAPGRARESAPELAPEFAPEPEPEAFGALEDLEGELRSGVLDLVADGYGFVRLSGLARSADDPYVPHALVRRYGLRRGEEISGLVSAAPGERSPRLVSVETVQGRPASEDHDERPSLDDLPAQRPSRRLARGRGPDGRAARMVEMVAPLGRGQRALIAGPPGSGTTSLLRELAREVAGPGVGVALIDVRPEEIPEWEASGVPVAAAGAGVPPREQVALAELALARAKRAAERGEDAVLLLDSITRLARAHGLARGGDDAPASAVEAVKRWFASARDAGQGSLTLIAVARVESESSLEELVFEALVDSANMVVRLDPELAARGLHPAIDARRSRTLGEEALVDEDTRRTLDALRGVMRSLDPAEAWEFMAEKAREGLPR